MHSANKWLEDNMRGKSYSEVWPLRTQALTAWLLMVKGRVMLAVVPDAQMGCVMLSYADVDRTSEGKCIRIVVQSEVSPGPMCVSLQ